MPAESAYALDNSSIANPVLVDGQTLDLSNLPAPLFQTTALIPCTYPTCNKTFKRASDRTRHEDSVHLNNPGIHLCPVPGCVKSHGKGYSRSDKVTEHLWKKHANLGYTKA